MTHDGDWTDYTWLVVMGALVAFFMAWGIGANDVANSFGTSVGAKTITLFQACIIATFMEFGGAIALGGEVAKTISGGIANPATFQEAPEMFAYGMLCALSSASIWVTVATYLELAVSTTHSIIGAVIGFALVWKGSDAVIWNQETDSFPYRTGLVPVVISWFASPLLAGAIGAILFFANRLLVLRRENSVLYAFWALPPLVGVTVFINIFFVLYKGAKNELHWDDKKSAWVSGCVAAGCVAFCVAVVLPWLWHKFKRETAAAEQAASDKASGKDVEDVKVDLQPQESVFEPTVKGYAQKYFLRLKTLASHGVQVDVHEDVHQDEDVAAMHAAAEVFDPKAEVVYQYLQVFSACCVSFAHGANDVANAVGPFAGIWYVYQNWTVSSSAATPKWILALGGAGIVLGLATYGYNIIKALGIKMAKMTPSRGYCAELSTALTVSVASVYGLPISTTHCIVGAEVGIGMTENIRTGANYKLFAKTFAAWVFTLVIAAFISAALFAQGVYSPSLTMYRKIQDYETYLNTVATTSIKAVNASNYNTAPILGRPVNAALLNQTTALSKGLTSLFNAKTEGYINGTQLTGFVQSSLSLWANNSVTAVGYNTRQPAFAAAQVTAQANP